MKLLLVMAAAAASAPLATTMGAAAARARPRIAPLHPAHQHRHGHRHQLSPQPPQRLGLPRTSRARLSRRWQSYVTIEGGESLVVAMEGGREESLHSGEILHEDEEEALRFEDGFKMEVLHSRPKGPIAVRPSPVVFIHGSFHSAWCFREHWMGLFASRGYESYSISLRGTSKSPDPLSGEIKAPSVEQHAIDVMRFLRVKGMLSDEKQKPVIVAHSFGGLVAMKVMEGLAERIGGLVLMCSVPPSGNGPMTSRFVQSRGWETVWDITRGFVFKDAAKEAELCRRFFFSPELDDFDVERYRKRFAKDSDPFFDLSSVQRRLPSRLQNSDGTASWAKDNPGVARLVIGAKEDFLVDQEGVEETARFLGVNKPVLVDSAHDVMLDVNQAAVGNLIIDWINANRNS